MRTFATSPIWRLIDWVGNLTTIAERFVYSVISFQWGFGSHDSPNFTNFRLQIGEGEKARHFGEPGEHDRSLYYNGVFFIRFCLPFYLGIGVRWCADCRRALLQTGIGWKKNGRFVIGGYWLVLWPVLWYFNAAWWLYVVSLCMIRIQSDHTSAVGMDGPNVGQATGFADGPH